MLRRSFLAAASVAAAAGANRRVRVGLIGCGGRGRYVTGFMLKVPDVELAAFADVHTGSARAAAGQTNAEVYQDYRRLLENKSIDAVVIATPDHWHAGCAVAALQAGKHIYVEKPLSYTIAEGRAIVNESRAHKLVAMTGTQHRSAAHFAEIADLIRSGKVGDVRFVRVWNYSNLQLTGLGKPEAEKQPDDLNWDMYLGPAPNHAYEPLRWKRTFRWFKDYAGGTITDFGTHRFDTVHQVMGVDQPKTVSASGGRFTLRNGGEMPDIQQVTYEYPGFVMSYEACNLNAHGLGGRRPGMVYYGAKGAEDRPNGMAFYGTNGAIFADRIGYEIYPEGDRMVSKQMNIREATPLHAAHFIDCIRDGVQPKAHVEIGQRATTIGLLGNIALATGEKLHWDGEKERFSDNSKSANALLWREPRSTWQVVKKPV